MRGAWTDRVVGAGADEDIVGVAVRRGGGGRSRQSGQVGEGVGAALFWHGLRTLRSRCETLVSAKRLQWSRGFQCRKYWREVGQLDDEAHVQGTANMAIAKQQSANLI